MKKLLFAILIAVISIPISGKDIRILAIGNSFSEDAIEQNLYELALEGGDNLIIGNAYRGGQGLESHWNLVNGSNNADFEYRKIVNGKKTNNKKTLLECITDEAWDYITFQQVSQDAGKAESYDPYLGLLLNYVKQNVTNSTVEYGLHQTWAYAKNSNHGGFAHYGNNQDTMYSAIISAINTTKGNHSSDIKFVIPSGTAIQNGRTSFIGDNFTRDGYHLDYGVGRYTAACTWLEVFTGQTPIGKKHKPESINEIVAKVAQTAAHDAVLEPNKVTSLTNMGYNGDNTITPGDPIRINFGSIFQQSGWNDVTTSAAYVIGLKDTKGTDTEIVVALTDDFNGTNTEGVQITTTPLNMNADVAKSCLWGYAQGSFGGNSQQATGGFSFSHLNKKLVYDFCLFGSRKSVSDNRETAYTVSGTNTRKGYLNAASNSSETVTIKGISPNENGEIRVTVAPGENNNNGNKFYYINALQITAREATPDDFVNKISNSRELLAMDPNSDYILTADIDLTNTKFENCVLDSYSGILDGQGHVIYGLKIENSNNGEMGLFRHLRGGTIKNLGIEKAHILGNANVGALVGQAHGGVIENCYVANSNISGRDHVGSLVGQAEGLNGTSSKIRNCYSSANVYSRDFQAGGLVGASTSGSSSIENCYFSGRIEVRDQRIGGILGLQDSDDMLTITNCVNLAAQLKCSQIFRIASTRDNKSTLTNNYALNTLPSPNGNEVQKGIDITAEQSKSINFYTENLQWIFDASTWKWIDGAYPVLAWQQEASTNTPLVHLSQSAPSLSLKQNGSINLAEFFTSGLGATVTYTCNHDKIQIKESTVSVANGEVIDQIETITILATAAGLKATEISIALVPDVISIATAEDFITKIRTTPSGNFKLTADLDFSSIEYNGIDNFTGQLNGNGHIVRNLNIQRSGDGKLGLFLSTNNAEIKNIGIENSTIGTGENKHIGAFVGEMNGGSISECYVVNSRIVGKDHVGALVGQLKSQAKMINCYSSAYVETTGWQAGGLVGSIEKSVIDKCYFSGVVVGKSNRTGGLVGLKNGGDATNTVVKNSVNMASYIIGNDGPKRVMGDTGIKLENNYSLSTSRIGKNVAEATSISSTNITALDGADITVQQSLSDTFYKDNLQWNITDTWVIPTGKAYPILKWQSERKDKLTWNIYEGITMLTPTSEKRLFLSVEDSFDLSKFSSSNGATLKYQSENSSIVSIDGLNITAKSTGSALVTIEANDAIKEMFTHISIQLNCMVIPETGVIELATPTDLLIVTAFPARSYILKNNIDMTDIPFKGLCSESNPFTGLFDGNRFIISGLKFNEPGTSAMGLFRKIKGATIKNVYLDNVNFVGNENIGGLIGWADAGKVEQCYVINSFIEGRDRTAAIAALLTNNTIIENSFVANSQVKAREHQAGGIAAATMEGGATIRNSYFEGSVESKFGHVGSILGLIDRNADVTIENCLNLASSITGGTPYRISSWGVNSDKAHFTNNYSISTTSGCNADADNRNGTTLLNDEDATSQTFYTATLTWDFVSIWKIEEGKSFPSFIVKDVTVSIDPEKSANSMTVFSTDGKLVVIVDKTQLINIYGIDGRLVHSSTVTEGRNTITGIAQGAYIVNNTKVIVR